MKELFNASLRYSYLLLLVVLYSCASAQVGTKNKKAYEAFGKALRHYDVMEYDEALALLNKALKKDPKYLSAYDLKGKIYQEQNKIDEAIIAYQKTLEIDPQYVYGYLELAEMYFDKGAYDKVDRYLAGLRDVKPNQRELYKDISKLKRNTEFAKKAVQNPVPFEPVNLGPSVNSELEDYFPGLTLDDSTLFFTRRDGSVSLRQQNEDLYMAQRKENGWEEAVNIGPPVNTQDNEGAFTTTIDGKYILFTGCNRRGGKGSCDIYFTYKKGGQWQTPRNMGFPISTPAWESQPTLASDGKTLYFVSNRGGGYGGTDIWKSVLTDKGWSSPVNLGSSINTPEDEQFPFIHPDGNTLYFTSKGHPGMGQSDIYFCKAENGVWGKPINIGYPINTSGDEWNFIVNRTGNKAYFSSNGIKDSRGGMDIYSFDLYELARPQTVSYVKGFVFDAKSKLPLGSEIQLIDLKTNEVVIETTSDKVGGDFLVTLSSNANYGLHVRKDGYLFHSENFRLEKSSLEKPYEIQVALQKVEIGKTVSLRNVFFDTDKAVLLPESQAELDILIKYLVNNPTIKIKIKGHTDDVGNDDHNLDLSKRRARAVYNYLIDNQIDAGRLKHEGYGEKQPITGNDTEEGRSKNRRTEFEIIQ